MTNGIGKRQPSSGIGGIVFGIGGVGLLKRYLSLPLQINLLATYGTDATLVRNSSQFAADYLGVVQKIPANVPCFPGMRWDDVLLEWFDTELDGITPLTTGQGGKLFEPLSTNKTLCAYFIEPDRTSYGPTYVEAQTLRKGSVCEIVTRTTLDFDTIGTLLSGTANAIGAQYLITGVALLGAGDSAKQDLAAIGTKSYYVDGAFVQNIRNSADGVTITLSGDVAGVLSIVADQTAVDAAGYGRQVNGGKVYEIDTQLTTGSCYIDWLGSTTNTTKHSFGLHYKADAPGISVYLNGGEGATPSSYSAEYALLKSENFDSVAGRYMRATISANIVCRFFAPQLEEQPFATGAIPSTAGATGTRAATILSVPTPLYTGGVWHQTVEWVPRGVAVGRIEWLWYQMPDTLNGLRAYSNGVQIVWEKVIAGVSEFATFDLPPIIGTSYKIDLLMYSDFTLGLFVNDVSAGVGLGSELVVNGGFTDGLTGWIVGSSATASVVGGQAEVVSTGEVAYINQTIYPQQAVLYKVHTEITSPSTNTNLNIGSLNTGSAFSPSIIEYITQEDEVVVIDKTVFGNVTATLKLNNSNGAVWGAVGDKAYYDNISARAINNSSTTAEPTINGGTTFIGNNGVDSCFANVQNVSINNRSM